MSETVTTPAVEKAPVQVTVALLKDLLNQGMDRKKIAAHLGLTPYAVAAMFKAKPELKGLKPKGYTISGTRKKPAPKFVFVDEETPATETEEKTVVPEPIAETTPVVETPAPVAEPVKEEESAW